MRSASPPPHAAYIPSGILFKALFVPPQRQVSVSSAPGGGHCKIILTCKKSPWTGQTSEKIYPTGGGVVVELRSGWALGGGNKQIVHRREQTWHFRSLTYNIVRRFHLLRSSRNLKNNSWPEKVSAVAPVCLWCGTKKKRGVLCSYVT